MADKDPKNTSTQSDPQAPPLDTILDIFNTFCDGKDNISLPYGDWPFGPPRTFDDPHTEYLRSLMPLEGTKQAYNSPYPQIDGTRDSSWAASQPHPQEREVPIQTNATKEKNEFNTRATTHGLSSLPTRSVDSNTPLPWYILLSILIGLYLCYAGSALITASIIGMAADLLLETSTCKGLERWLLIGLSGQLAIVLGYAAERIAQSKPHCTASEKLLARGQKVPVWESLRRWWRPGGGGGKDEEYGRRQGWRVNVEKELKGIGELYACGGPKGYSTMGLST
ncbi:hypothetical protein EJ06DRAFT_581284 [Trichodelitschia bisporula]|uniref:Uncharacterized protein n=1 Tax=Trichodelitschia bisporula TaxID=703511 RepID=A0A6G1HYG9_9PEZI|nr:hypothetical protein EJ06DRAFT_581284 [Trichodelitschia bisporula]